MEQSRLDELVQDGGAVSAAFDFADRLCAGTPCPECRSTDTSGTVCMGAVILSCNVCGCGRRCGPLGRLWDGVVPPQRAVGRPVLRHAVGRSK